MMFIRENEKMILVSVWRIFGITWNMDFQGLTESAEFQRTTFQILMKIGE